MDLFSNLKSFFKVNAACIDNSIFRLHYKITSAILLAFSILVTARQYYGDPIDCVSGSAVPGNMLDGFCWVHSTFSVPSAWEKEVGEEIVYPGVDKYTRGEKRVYHSYYQWVCFVLFLQAILFYTPWYFWKATERGRIKSMTLGLNSPILNAETKAQNKKLLVEYLASSIGQHSTYFMSFAFSEIANFVNVVGQIFLIDIFLGKEFTTYGTKVLEFTNWEGSVRYDPMIRIFPRITKCSFSMYGNSGDVQRIDALCILPINIINEKIYIFLWFWFIILAVLSGFALIYRYLIFWSPKSRYMATRARARIVDTQSLRIVIEKCKLGDWFLLHLLSKNLEPLNFRDVVHDLANALEGKTFDLFGAPRV